MRSPFYVKSFEEDFVLKTLNGTQKVPFQSINEIISSQRIKPNTKSFGKEMRLSTTIINPHYTKTYRPQGLIFQTKAKPDYILPCDLLLCSTSNKIVVQYYRIQNKLHEVYNHDLIPGYEKFIFSSYGELFKKFPSPSATWKEINRFRMRAGFKELPKSKSRLAQYNEAVFHHPIAIKTIALYGYRPHTRALAKKLGIPCYRSAKEFVEKEMEK